MLKTHCLTVNHGIAEDGEISTSWLFERIVLIIEEFDIMNAHHGVLIYKPNILWGMKNIFTGDLKYTILNTSAKGATVTQLNRVLTVLTPNHSFLRFL